MPLVVVVGQGYVGLPLAMRAVEVGHRVVGFDTDEVRTARLAAGDSYIDDVPSVQLKAALASGRYMATRDEKAVRGIRRGPHHGADPVEGGRAGPVVH